MAEETVKQDVKQADDAEKQEQLGRLIIGSDSTAIVEVKKYKFKIHYPSVLEGLKVQVVAKNLRKDVENDDDFELKLQTTILATFDVICEEIIKVGEKDEILTLKDDRGNSIRKLKFIEFVDKIKDPMVWTKLVLPLFDQYLKFSSDIAIKENELKN